MPSKLKLAIAGLGLIGKRHAEAIDICSNAELSFIVDPSEEAFDYAKKHDILWYPSLSELFQNQKPDGIILATPNNMHLDNGLECIKAGCPIIIEKPLATTPAEGELLVKAAKAAKVPLLVGHHRRHNSLIQKAYETIKSGEIGEVRAAHAVFWMYKTDDYFDAAPWRKQQGAGPIKVNLIHDIDLICYLCGDVEMVQAQAAKSARGYENEDVAAAILRFKNGAIATITVSDMIVSPWSWEMTARENPVYTPVSQSCYTIGGTLGSLSLPDLTLWKNQAEPNWFEPITATSLPRDYKDPLINQIYQFCAVIKGEEEPLVSGEDGLRALRVIEAIYQAALYNKSIYLS